MPGWVIVWESKYFNSKGVEPGIYGSEDIAKEECDKFNNMPTLGANYFVTPVDSPRHLEAKNHKFSWRK